MMLRQSAKTIATVFLLPDCDLSCRFCASDLGFDCMEESQALHFMEELSESGYQSVVLGGGEPLLWPGDLFRIAGRARELGLTVQLNTNGVAWPEGLENNNGIQRVILPLDGASRASHDWLRAPRGGHRDLVEDRLGRLISTGKEATVGTVVCKKNQTELPLLYRELKEKCSTGLQLHAWHLYRFRPVGRGGARANRETEFGLAKREFRDLCTPLQTSECSFQVFRRPDMTRSREVDFFWFQDGALKTGFNSEIAEEEEFGEVRSRLELPVLPTP
ncbi:MAG: hypothetical protein CMJ96_08265 [Planctomycetes bacterium]|nr:hypothetical protein [Planctomycetota bacterium]MDP7245887.1 radical SAM protein [Planctomycetota bacterium]|tara:strand:- start:31187 stop:32011 length:825 start_codon:yes stop_codon:yes gene_type:complete